MRNPTTADFQTKIQKILFLINLALFGQRAWRREQKALRVAGMGIEQRSAGRNQFGISNFGY